MTTRYTQIAVGDVPHNVRFDAPRRNQGQIVEIAYGGYSGSAHDEGDPYMRIHDRSDGEVTYYRRADGERRPTPIGPGVIGARACARDRARARKAK